MWEYSPCYHMLKWYLLIGLLISFNLAESLTSHFDDNEVTRSKRDVVDAKTIGNALYEPEEDVIIKREEIPIPPFVSVQKESNVDLNKDSLSSTESTGDVKSTIKKEHGSQNKKSKTQSKNNAAVKTTEKRKKESLKKVVQARGDVLKKEEDESLIKGMDSNVDHPLIKSDLTKQYRDSTDLDHGEIMGIETERDDINEPITNDNSLLKNNIKFNTIENDVVPKEHFFTDAQKKTDIITTKHDNVVKNPKIRSSTKPNFTVVKRSANLDNDLLPLSKLNSHYALEGGEEMADGGPPSHFQVDDKSADLEINANSAGVKVKAKPALLQVVSKPGTHGAGARPYVLPIHHYEYLDDEFHEGNPYRRSSCCHHRHRHGFRRCCHENPDQYCCHHRRRHHIPRHHHHHHHRHHQVEFAPELDDDDSDYNDHHVAKRHHSYHHHPRHVNFSPEDNREDNAYRRHLIRHHRHHPVNFARQPYDESGLYRNPVSPSIDSDLSLSPPGRISAAFNPEQYGGFALPGSMTIPDRMMDMDGSRRDGMYNDNRGGFGGYGGYGGPYVQRFSRSFHPKNFHDVHGYSRSAVETAMDPRLGSVANANGFNSGIALPDEDAMYFSRFRPEAMDERERIHQSHLRKIQDSTYKQFADEMAYKQQNIAMDSHRFPTLMPKQFHQYHQPVLPHPPEFHALEDDESRGRGLSYHDTTHDTTHQNDEPYHEYHHYGNNARHTRHRFANLTPTEKYHDRVRYFNGPSQSSAPFPEEESRDDAFEKAELSSRHSDDIEKSEQAARTADSNEDMGEPYKKKKRNSIHPHHKREKVGSPRYSIPAGHAPISPMGLQPSSEDDDKSNLGDRTLEQGASSLPEVHGDFGLQTSEQEEAMKQDREFEHIAKIQDEMYKKLGAVLPLGDVPRQDYHEGVEPDKTYIKPEDMSGTALPDDQPIERLPGEDSQDSHSVASSQARKELESEDEENAHEKQHMSNHEDQDNEHNDREEGNRYNEHSRHNEDEERGREEEDEHRRKHHMPHEEYEHDEPNYNSYKKDNLPVNHTAESTPVKSNVTSLPSKPNIGNETTSGMSMNKTTEINGTDRNPALLTVNQPSSRGLTIEVMNGKSENIYGKVKVMNKTDITNNTAQRETTLTQVTNHSITPLSSTNGTVSPSSDDKAKQVKTRRRRSAEYFPTLTKKKNISLTLEKTAHSKGGKKNSVVVQRPPIIYHPPPEIIHRPTIIFHRPPIVLQRPPIIYHQPPIIVHRPAVVYKQPPLIFHQPSPMISQPLIASHDKYVPSFTLQHLSSVLENGGTVPIFPKVARFRNNRRLGNSSLTPNSINLGGMDPTNAHAPDAVSFTTPGAVHNDAMQYASHVGDASEPNEPNEPSDASGATHEDGENVVQNGVNDGREDDPITIPQSDENREATEVASPSGTGMLGTRDGTVGQLDGHPIQSITVNEENDMTSGMRKSNISIGSKKSYVKINSNAITSIKQQSIKRSSKLTSKAMKRTKIKDDSYALHRQRREINETNEKRGKKGVKKDVVVNRPPIIYHPPPEIYHRPDIVIHRPPIVIHRPPIIYHQPPVIVHRPAVVYHQPPIVFHQPPPAVQQPLLYSHDTFVMHPTYVAQHLGSILRTAPHYIGPPRMLTNMGQPIRSSYPMPLESDDFNSRNLDDGSNGGSNEDEAAQMNAQPIGDPGQQSAARQQMIQQDLQNGGGIENAAQLEGQGGMDERGEQMQQSDENAESMQAAQNGMMAGPPQPQDMMPGDQQTIAKRSHIDKLDKRKSTKHTKIPGYMKQIFDKLYDSSHLSHNSKQAPHGNFNIIDQRPGLMRRKVSHKKDKIHLDTNKFSEISKIKKQSNTTVGVISSSSAMLTNETSDFTGIKKSNLHKQSEKNELASKRNCMEYHDNCCHEECPPQHARHVHHHHRHIHHEDHQIVLHRPGVIYHPAPTVVHRPDIIIHRPPLLVHRPVIVVHQPPVILHRPPVYYKQPDVIFHTPHSIVREPTIYSHDIYTHVPHLQQVDSHIENHELTTHIGNECNNGQMGYNHGYGGCTNSIKGDTYHDKGIGDYYNTQNYGNMGEQEEEEEDNARSDIAHKGEKNSHEKIRKKESSSTKRKNIPSSKNKNKYFHLQNTTSHSNSTKRQMIGHRLQHYQIEPATHEINSPVHHRHHRRLHVGEQNIVLHRPGVIYHPSPTVVHRPIIVIHRPPLLVHRPSIVVHQPPVVIHRPPVYYKQPDVVFHTPPPEVHEPMYQSHDLYKQVPRLEHVDSHIEQTETLVHPEMSGTRADGATPIHGGYALQGDHYHDKGIGDVYGTSNYGDIRDSGGTKTGTSRSDLPFSFDKEYDFDANSDNNDEKDDMSETGAPRDTVLHSSQDTNDMATDSNFNGGFGGGAGAQNLYYAEPFVGNVEQQQQQQQQQQLNSDTDHSNLLQNDFNSHDDEFLNPNTPSMNSMLNENNNYQQQSNSLLQSSYNDDFAPEARSTIHRAQNSTKKQEVARKSGKKNKNKKHKILSKKKTDVSGGGCGECTDDCQPPCLPSGFTSIAQEGAQVMSDECGVDDERNFCHEPICEDQHSCHHSLEGISCAGCAMHSQMPFHDCEDHSCNEEMHECHPSCQHPSTIQFNEHEGPNGALHLHEGSHHGEHTCNLCEDPCDGHTCNIPVRVECGKGCHAPITPKLPMNINCGNNCQPPSTHICHGDICNMVENLQNSCHGDDCHIASSCEGPNCHVPVDQECQGDNCHLPVTALSEEGHNVCEGSSCHESCEGSNCHLANLVATPICEGDSCHEDSVAPCEGSSCHVINDHNCEGDSCHSACVGESCHSPCEGDSCHSPCEGDSCHSPCEGDSCHSPCEGDSCHSPCDGDLCHSPCEGDSCHSPCIGPNCHLHTTHLHTIHDGSLPLAEAHPHECDLHNGCHDENKCVLPYCGESPVHNELICDDSHTCSSPSTETCEGEENCHPHPVTTLHEEGIMHQVHRNDPVSCLGPACHGPIHPMCQDTDCNTPVHVCGGHPCADSLHHCEGHDCHEPVQICGARVCTQSDNCHGENCDHTMSPMPIIGAHHAVVHHPIVVHPVIHHHKYYIHHVMNASEPNPQGDCYCHGQIDCHCYTSPKEILPSEANKKSKVKKTVKRSTTASRKKQMIPNRDWGTPVGGYTLGDNNNNMNEEAPVGRDMEVTRMNAGPPPEIDAGSMFNGGNNGILGGHGFGDGHVDPPMMGNGDGHEYGHEIRHDSTVYNRPNIVVPQPPDIVHRPDIVIHRAPIIIHRRPVIYHQSPVVVHKPPIIVHQAPIVVHPIVHHHKVITHHVHDYVVQPKVINNECTCVGEPECACEFTTPHTSPACGCLGSADCMCDMNSVSTTTVGNGLPLSTNDPNFNCNACVPGSSDESCGRCEISKKKNEIATTKTKKITLRTLIPHPSDEVEDKKSVHVTEKEGKTAKRTLNTTSSHNNENITLFNKPNQHAFFTAKKKKKDVVVSRPPIIYHPPPEIYHRPDIVVHRPPLLIHRPSIIYHQPPVIVHRPAVVYHQPPLVFHQPPPAVQQPLLVSHDTFRMHPSAVYTHMGSVVNKVGSYVGVPHGPIVNYPRSPFYGPTGYGPAPPSGYRDFGNSPISYSNDEHGSAKWPMRNLHHEDQPDRMYNNHEDDHMGENHMGQMDDEHDRMNDHNEEPFEHDMRHEGGRGDDGMDDRGLPYGHGGGGGYMEHHGMPIEHENMADSAEHDNNRIDEHEGEMMSENIGPSMHHYNHEMPSSRLGGYGGGPDEMNSNEMGSRTISRQFENQEGQGQGQGKW